MVENFIKLFLNSMALFIIAISIGCSYRPFQPPPPLFKVWHKSGATEPKVLNDLIGCGFSHDEIYSIDKDEITKESLNKYAAAQLCMLNMKYKNDGFTHCQYFQKLPACVNYKTT